MAEPVRIAHLINPFAPPPGSEWEYVQPITMASMEAARDAAMEVAQVDLLTAQYAGDHEVIPKGFRKTPDLERSVLDVHPTEAPPYPLIGDLMQRLYDHSEAEYLVYTNIDIAVQPHFYHLLFRTVLAIPFSNIVIG